MTVKKILVVDDDDFMRETVADVLMEKDYEVALAESGEEAIKMYRERSFDVILLDLKMQGIDGFQTYQEIKQIDPQAKAIIMTAYFYEDIINDCLREGAFGVLYKPLDMDKVLEQIEIAHEKRIIMIVDDDEGLRLRLKELFEEEGYHVLPAHSKEDALKQVIHVPPDVVIADVSGEVTEGKDVCTLIRQIVPSVDCIVTARDKNKSEAIVTACVNNGAKTSMYKPFDLIQFVSNVKRIIEANTDE